MSGVKLHARFLNGRIRHLSAAFVIAMVFTVGYSLGVSQSRTAAQDWSNTSLSPEAEQEFQPLFQVFNLIRQQYIDDVEPDVLIDGAAQGMVDALEDHYSAYMNPEVYPILNSSLSGEFEGIGVVITTNEETEEIEVVGVLEGAPAAEAGLLPGDVFVQVNGESIEGWTQTEFAGKVRGPEGSPVDLQVRRGDQFLDFTIVRARIVTPIVETELLQEDTIAYIRLNDFTADARQLLDEAIDELDVNSRQGLIVDVRGNPGGYLTSAIEVTSAFVESGTIVVEDFGDGNETTYTADGTYAGISVPIVLLIDETSASASEILAGALQDFDLATLIGETTFGKGTVQTWQPLVNGGGVRLTIARWLTPNGQWIDGQGVQPDIVVEFTPAPPFNGADPQLDAALQFLSGISVEMVLQSQP